MDAESRQSTLFPSEALAKISAPRASARASRARVPACSFRRPALLTNAGQLLQFGKTFPALLTPTVDGILQQSSIRFANSGRMTWRGELSTLNTSECRSNADACTLLQILEADAPAKFYLTPNGAAGILRRATKRGREIMPALLQALTALAAQAGRTLRTTMIAHRRPGQLSKAWTASGNPWASRGP